MLRAPTMTSSCPDCGTSMEFDEREVHLRTGTCPSCSKEYAFVEGSTVSARLARAPAGVPNPRRSSRSWAKAGPSATNAAPRFRSRKVRTVLSRPFARTARSLRFSSRSEEPRSSSENGKPRSSNERGPRGSTRKRLAVDRAGNAELPSGSRRATTGCWSVSANRAGTDSPCPPAAIAAVGEATGEAPDMDAASSGLPREVVLPIGVEAATGPVGPPVDTPVAGLPAPTMTTTAGSGGGERIRFARVPGPADFPRLQRGARAWRGW